ncbi:KdsC family phosphatase [Vibrio splendidus]|uniref:KdsC family phosphatase n=1 Tax=Vibrio splendidus TaxID=29497 RepID=UPI00352FD93A
MYSLEKCQKVKMVLFDVDGVMTDGSIYIDGDGEFFKSFNAKDGLAIELLRSHKIITGVISGKASTSLSKRCEQLGFDEVITGCKNKLPALIELCNKYEVSADEVAFLGDDVLDLPVLKVVGLPVAPLDAHLLVKEHVQVVCSAKGGQGMVREFVDMFLKTKLSCSLADIYNPLLNSVQENKTTLIEQ